ncbi:GAF domain-containing protein [Arthrobacter sp. MDT2-16]
MKAVTQQWLTRQVLVEADVDAFEAWVVYVGLGGTSAGILVDGYLHGLLPAPSADRDLIARAVNVLLAERPRHGRRAPLRSERVWRDAEEPFASYGDSAVQPADLVGPLVGPAEAEDLRVESLGRTGLLGLAHEEQLDVITAEAARRFPGCSSALLLVAGERQVVRSACGSFHADGPRGALLARCTLDGPGPFVVTDALQDPRMASCPAEAGEPSIGFYAGRPVHGPGGWRIGSLCVVAATPRGFSPEDARSLQMLAASVQGLIRVQVPPVSG